MIRRRPTRGLGTLLLVIVASTAHAQGWNDLLRVSFIDVGAMADKLQRQGLAGDYIELFVVDKDRQQGTRPGAQ